MRRHFEPLEARRFLNAGQLDTSFGNSGHLVLGQSTGVGDVDLDVTPQDQIVVTASESQDVRVWRLTRDGKIDANFGPLGDGTFTAPLITINDEHGTPELMAGATVIGSDSSFFILQGNVIYKFRPNGTRDKSFGKNGRAIAHALNPLKVQDFTVDDQGRAYVVGADAKDVLTIVRLAANGKPDLDFGIQSVLQPRALSTPAGFKAQRLDDGGILFAGSTSGTATPGEFSTPAFDIDEIKLTPAGALARSYGKHGVVVHQWSSIDIYPNYFRNVHITPDGFVFVTVDGYDDPSSSTATVPYGPDGNDATIPLTSKIDATAVVHDGGLLATISLSDDGYDGQPFLSQQGLDLRTIDGAPDTVANGHAQDAMTGWFPEFLVEQQDRSLVMMSVPDSNQPVQPVQPLRVDRFFVDDSPAAQVSAKPLVLPHAESYRFSVTYRDDDAVSLASLGDDDITILFPDGSAHHASLVKMDALGDAKTVTVTYRIAGLLLAGKYAIRLNGHSVRDIHGNPSSRRLIGSFVVQNTQ